MVLAWITCVTPHGGLLAQEDGDQPRTEVTVAPTGLQRFSSGRWSSVSVVAANPTDEDSLETVAVYFKEAPQQQFAATFWVPAKSSRQTWIPVRVPKLAQRSGRITLSSIRLKQTGQGESFANNQLGMSVGERSLMLNDNEINTALCTDSFFYGADQNGRRIDAFIEGMLGLINCGRDTTITSQLELPTSKLKANFLPPTNEALDELDQLVIAGDHLLGDSSGLSAVRSWIRGGGRAWIMLDRTSESLVRELLGDAARYSVVDRVELNEFQLEMGAGISGSPGQIGDRWTSEQPVEMLRVFAESEDVDAWIDGWPASFWQRYGDGEIVFSTLGHRGWFKEDDGKLANSLLYRVSRRFFEPRVVQPDDLSQMRPLLSNAIGYEIPSRGVAALILGGNALVILIAGVWWARRRSLEKMAILIPVCALVTTAAMLGVGASHTASVPSTVATGQLVTVNRHVPEADVRVVRGVYLQQAGDPAIISPDGLLTMPDADEGTSATRRVSIDDDGGSRLVGPDQPPGVIRHLSSESSLTFDRPVALVGTFDERGFAGELQGMGSAEMKDGVIVALPSPSTALQVDPSGDEGRSLRADAEARLSPGQFIPGTLLDDEQRMHQDYLRRVCVRTEEGAGMGARLSCLFWTDPLELNVRFDRDFTQSGVSLVSVPVDVRRPQVAEEFRIPATFVRTEGYAGSRGISSMFNTRTGEWLQGLTAPAETELMLRFPPAVSGMTIRKIDVEMKVSAPSRSLYVKTKRDGEPFVTYETRNPAGLIRFSIGEDEPLQLDPAGGLWIAIGVSESENVQIVKSVKDPRADEGIPEPIAPGRTSAERKVDNTTWQIEHAYFDVVASIEADENEIQFELPKAGSP